ncbi:unnamed protein product, partial [Coregonus sp. 'balchen']
TMNQMLEKMKQGDHVFDVNAEAEPDEEECQDFRDDFDGDYEEGQGDYVGEGSKEHKDSCKAGGPGRGSCPTSPESTPTSALEPWLPGQALATGASNLCTRAATTNTKSALSTSNKKTTLAADFQFPPETLSQLSLKPASIGGDSDDDDDGEGFNGGADDTQPSADSNLVSSQDNDNVSTYGEDDLVPEPHRVNKIEINYAKTAKKMDMKRLKNTMWNLLTDSLEKTAKVNFKVLPLTMAQNLSVPLAFVALLHLANEKNLELVKVDDMSDIIIKQGAPENAVL